MLRFNTCLRGLLVCFCMLNSPLWAADAGAEVEYIEVEPVIVTNYLRAKGKKPGFVQLQTQLVVRGTEAAAEVEKHLPLVRDTIIEFLSFTEEAIIKDVSKRNEFRMALKDQVNKVLSEHLKHPYAEDLVITHYMYD